MLLQAVDDAGRAYTAYKVGTAAIALLGKRQAACAERLTSQQAAEVAKELIETCSKLDFDPIVGLTRKAVDVAFESSDGEYEKQDSAFNLYLSLEFVMDSFLDCMDENVSQIYLGGLNFIMKKQQELMNEKKYQ